MKIRILILLIAVFTVNRIVAQESFSTNGFVRNYTGILAKSPYNFSIIQNTFELRFEKRTDKIAFKVNPFIYHYSDRNIELGLREAYMDLLFTNFDIRIGKQQIIWGKAEGVFITDIVSPKDLREFLLPAFDEIRSGITAFKINYYVRNQTIEAVWSPVFTPTQMPENGSIWDPKFDFPIIPNWDYSKSNIAANLENSEVFLRYSLMASAFDMELVGGYFFYDDPVLHITKQIDPTTLKLISMTVCPDYKRVTMAGGSVSIPIGGFIFRGEGAYYSGRNFQTTDPNIPDATIEKSNLHYMAGLDYSLGGVKLSAQFIQEYILDYSEGIYNDKTENTMTFLAKKDFFREKLWIELFAYIGLNNKDALIRPKIIYNFADGFEIQAGANIFTGQNGRFGQYDANDMLYLKLKYSF